MKLVLRLVTLLEVMSVSLGVALPLMAGTPPSETSTSTSTTEVEQATPEYGEKTCFEDEMEIEVNGERFCVALDDLRKLDE